MKRHGFSERENHIGPVFYREYKSNAAWQGKILISRYGYKFKSYNKRYSRSNQYRKMFFETHKGPYRCAYCGRRIKASELEVDHCIPVSKAKSSGIVRILLFVLGIYNVNSPRNLVASCRECNRKKSDDMGWWVIKGAFGRFKWFWAVRNLLIGIFVIALVLIILFCLNIIQIP